ncbi:MAG: gamma-glutamyltransferase [Alphaproteobacteria bacterium]|jgi:gamma-glutamyltranspeptidase/glutathione hydrolase|nr:gamma-glutamyltransferase [Candidatus Jidaibacter sp.]
MLRKLFICLLVFITPIISFVKDKNFVGAVSTGHPLATKAGIEILENGGNAFDAAVAITSMLNVVEPAMTGLGGYGSSLIYDAKNGEIRYLNGSGRFPKNTNSDLMREPTPDYKNNRKGAKSISTPGNLNSWKAMHLKYGVLPWNKLFDSTIKNAKYGFPVSPYIAVLIADSFNEFSEYSKSFYGVDGRPLKEGELLVQKDLAKTYELIAKEGTDPFYKGEIAKKMHKQVQGLGGFLSLEDLNSDTAEWWEPIKVNYHGYDIYTMGTPGNGFSALFALGVLERFNLKNMKHNSPEYLHVLIEALKKSIEVRLSHSGSVEERENIVNNILTKENFAKVAKNINLDKASKFEVNAAKEGLNTTHFVVVDKFGNIVSSTQTLGLGFGSKIMIEGTGIWMNNSMAFSTFEPKGNPMDVFPGKYKISSNSPTIIMKDGKPWAALGTPGGHTIPQNVAQIVANLIAFDMDMQKAIDAPKTAFFEEEDVVVTEPGIKDYIILNLKKKGHNIANKNVASYIGLSGRIGNAMGVKILYDKKGNMYFDTGIDRRKDGWSTTHLYHNKH